jgi:hypothetical protein
MSDQTNDRETTDTIHAPAEESIPPTNRGRDLPPSFMGNPAPVPPPGADQTEELGALIARMEATLNDIEGAATKLDMSAKLFVGQAKVLHQEMRSWMSGIEKRVADLEAWKATFDDDGK